MVSLHDLFQVLEPLEVFFSIDGDYDLLLNVRGILNWNRVFELILDGNTPQVDGIYVQLNQRLLEFVAEFQLFGNGVGEAGNHFELLSGGLLAINSEIQSPDFPFLDFKVFYLINVFQIHFEILIIHRLHGLRLHYLELTLTPKN